MSDLTVMKKIRHYTINKVINFFPEKCLIVNIETDIETTLYVPASKIFERLIQAGGDVVSYNDLIAAGWPGKENKTTLNNFYQTISYLRKELNKISPEINIIQTVKRSGLLIPADGIDSVYDTPSAEITEENSKTLCSTLDIKFLTNAVKLFIIVFISFIIVSGYFSYQFYMQKKLYGNVNYVSSFTFFRKISSGCNIFINNDERHKENTHPQFNLDEFNCRGYTDAYITMWKMRKRSSVLLCRKKQMGNDDNNITCKTFYYGSNS